MGETIKREVPINGNRYYVVGKEQEDFRRVSVYDNSLHSYYPDSNDIIYRKRRKALILGIGQFLFNPPPLEEMMEKALDRAVYKFEQEQAEEAQLEEKVEHRLDAVKESYEQ